MQSWDLYSNSSYLSFNWTGNGSILQLNTSGNSVLNRGLTCNSLMLPYSTFGVSLSAPTLTASSNYTLPSTYPSSSGQVVTSTTGGVMSWASTTSTLAGCTDCSIGSPAIDQLLVYTTASSLNKWTPYTSGATFNDSTKTITLSAGSSALASDTDVSIRSPSK